MQYDIQMTPLAEESYSRLYDRAQSHLTAGEDGHPDVVTFNAVENAMDSVLSENPCQSEFGLAGVCSILYRIPLGSVAMCYVVQDWIPAVIVLTITRTQSAMRMWLVTAIRNGDVDDLLKHLQIDKPSASVVLTSGLLH